MRHFIILLLSIFLTSNISYSIEVNELDSLKNLLSTSINDSTPKILNEIGTHYFRRNPDSCLKYSNLAITLSREFKIQSEEAKAYKNIGIMHFFKGDNDNSLKQYNKALVIYQDINDTEGLASIYNNIGIIHNSLNEYQKAIDYYEMSIFEEKKLDNQIGISKTFNNIGIIYQKWGKYDKSNEYFEKSLKIKEELYDNEGISKTLNNIGINFLYQSDYINALDCYNRSLDIKKSIDDKPGIAMALYNIGMVYNSCSQYDKALKFYLESLEYRKKVGDKNGIASLLNNIGNLYSSWSNNDKSFEYFTESLNICKEIKNNEGIAIASSNIGLYYDNKKEYDKALFYYLEALEVFKRIGNNRDVSKIYSNIGEIYKIKEEYDFALDYFFQALKISQNIGIKDAEAISLSSISSTYYKLKNIDKAYIYAKEGLKVSEEIDNPEIKISIYKILSDIYEKRHQYKEANELINKYVSLKDSIFNINKHKQLEELNTKYQTAEKEKEIELLNEKDRVNNLELIKNKQEIKIKNIYIFLFSIVLILIAFFSYLIYKQYTEKKYANELLINKNEEIETQRDLLSVQKKELSDSIIYAKNIQSAILPTNTNLSRFLNDYFTILMPKDIVSGDFYWLSEKNNKIVLAAADCTGHGVPGAFMSILGISFLNEIVNEKNITQPNTILNILRDNIISSLNQNGKEGEAKDGMDISLITIDKTTNKLEFSGANCPLYIIRNKELIEIKGDKMPIAIHEKMDSFNNHSFDFEKGDCLYIFSDGFVDQFGGEKGKKFKYRPFKQMLIDINHLPMDKQKYIINYTFSQWKGNHEQVDDILLIGVCIN